MENSLTSSQELSNSTLDILIKWLEGGELFSKSGGVLSWHDPTQDSSPFEYSEITGYFLTLVTYLSSTKQIGEHSVLINRAHKAANWLTDAYDDHVTGVKYRDNSNLYYSFDNSIIAYGLINFYMLTGNAQYLSTAKKLIDGLVKDWFIDNNLICFKDETNKVLDNDKTWSTSFGSFHAKLNLSLIKLFQITKDEEYLNFSNKLTDLIINKFFNGQYFNTYKEEGAHLHPLLYTLEGLLFKDIQLGEKKYFSIIEKNLNWIFKINGNQLFRSILNDNLNTNMRSDISFQLLRILQIIETFDYCDTPNFNTNLIIKETSAFQTNKSIFTFGSSSGGEEIRHLTSWVNFMAIQTFANSTDDHVKESIKFFV